VSFQKSRVLENPFLFISMYNSETALNGSKAYRPRRWALAKNYRGRLQGEKSSLRVACVSTVYRRRSSSRYSVAARVRSWTVIVLSTARQFEEAITEVNHHACHSFLLFIPTKTCSTLSSSRCRLLRFTALPLPLVEHSLHNHDCHPLFIPYN
jgi:hypothetical protein